MSEYTRNPAHEIADVAALRDAFPATHELAVQKVMTSLEPTLAIIVEIETLFIHCAKAFRRAKLWEPATYQDRKEMPSLVQIVLEQTTGAPSDKAEMDALDAGLEEAYKTTMY